MLIKLLKTNNLSALVLFLLFAIVLFIVDWLMPSFSTSTHTHPLFFKLFNIISANSWSISLILFLVIGVISLHWNHFLVDQGVLKNSGFLIASTYLIVASVFTASSIWVVTVLVLFLLQLLMSMYKKKSCYGSLYDAGCLVGLSIIVYVPSVFLIPLIYLGILIYANATWRTLIIPLIGLLTPFLFLVVYGYLFKQLDQLAAYYFSYFTSPSLPSFWSANTLVFLGTTAIVLLLSIVEILKWYGIKNLRSRKAYSLFVCYCICVSLATFFSHQQWNHLLLLALPISVSFANYFLHAKKKWWYESVYVILFLVVLYFKLSVYIES